MSLQISRICQYGMTEFQIWCKVNIFFCFIILIVWNDLAERDFSEFENLSEKYEQYHNTTQLKKNVI